MSGVSLQLLLVRYVAWSGVFMSLTFDKLGSQLLISVMMAFFKENNNNREVM